MKRKILSILTALSLSGTSGLVARADEGSTQDETARNVLSSVRVVREATQTLVRIEGSRTPVFSVYTLEDPLRLVVDVSQGVVDKLETPMDVEDGVITKIVAAQYGEGARAVGRVIIGFVRRVPYDIKAEDNGLVVRVAAVGKERPSEATLRDRERQIEERNKALQRKDEELQKLREDREAELQKVRDSKDAEMQKLREALTARAEAAADAERRAREELKQKESDSARAKEKDDEVQKLRDELFARSKEAADTKAAVLAAERAKQEEATRRAGLERRLADAEAEATRLREKAAGSEELQSALEKARNEVARASKELGDLRQEVSSRADAETRARAEAAEAARALEKARRNATELREALSKSQNQSEAVERARTDAQEAGQAVEALRKQLADAQEAARKAKEEAASAQAEQASKAREAAAAAVLRLEASSKALGERLAVAEQRAKELESLRERLATHKSAEAAAKELIAHKEGEISGLRKRLDAAEGVARATAEELDRARKREAERLRSAENAHAVAHGQNVKAAEALASPGKALVAAPEARVTLAKGEVGPARAPVVIKNVDFKSKEGHSRVVLRVEGEPHYVVTRGDGKLVLDLPGARLPHHLRRRLDVSEFGGPVRMVSAYEASNPVQATRVTVDLRGPASYEVTRTGQDLELEVKGAGAPVAAAPKRMLLAQAGGVKDEVPEVLEEKKEAPRVRKRAKPKKQVYRGRRINLDLQDADIHTVLKLISEVIRLNFVVSDDVKGKVSMTLRDVPWDQALEIILKSKDLGYQREGNIIRVVPEKILRAEAEEEAKKEVVVKESQPVLLKIIPVNYGKADELMPRVKDVLSERGAVSFDKRTNTLIVRDIQMRLRAAEKLVKKLDLQTPQVLIEARIVEANTIFTREIGIQWGGNFELSPANGNPTGLSFPSTIGIGGGAPLGLSSAQGILNPSAPNFGVNLPATVGLNQGGALGFTFGNIGGTVNLNLRLSAAEEAGQAKIISAPKITTLDNQKATIQQGVSIPISQASALGVNTIFVDANLTLTVTPHVTQDGSVIMDIIATKNEPDFQRTGGLGDPTITRKEARTSVLIKDGETTVIGGIYTRNQSTNKRGIPFLSDIPILGWLFKKTLRQDNRTELLIFITPRIVNRPDSIGS